MFDLREYQVSGYEAAMAFFQQEAPKPGILVAPTAYGKSVLIAHVANNVEGRTLILQPSKELLEQNYNKFISLGGFASIYSASFGKKKISNTVYATIGSIKSIGKTFGNLGFANLIIDEVHLYPRGTESMLGTFLEQSGIKKVLGLTATPFKLQSNTDMNGERFSKLQMLTSRSKMGQFFQEIIHVTQIQEVVGLGYWSKLEYELHDFNDRGLVYNSVKSDYTEQSLRFNFEDQDLSGKILYRLQQLHDRKSVIIFVPTIEEAEALASKIPSAFAVHSNLHPEKRKSIIEWFRSGAIKVVVNVNILAAGFDHPGVDCIICARPTASLAWFYQALGRGTRIDEHKANCLIIDFAGNVTRFGRIEHIYFKRKKTWQCYGEGGRLLTGLAMDQIGTVIDADTRGGVVLPFGKYKGKQLTEVPRGYIDYMLGNFIWNDSNMYLKQACEKLLKD